MKFGGCATPERNVTFDSNSLDETLRLRSIGTSSDCVGHDSNECSCGCASLLINIPESPRSLCCAFESDIAAFALAFAWSEGHAQSIEPRAYSNAPVGVNSVLAGYAYTRRSFAFDSSLPITDPDLKTDTGLFGYARVLDLWGKSGKFDAIAYSRLSGTGTTGATGRARQGFGDPSIRLSVNFYGAPALI